ncbi:MAG TPA: AI-2E family transporter [Chitinophagaceae bacterium]|nr:AI-2E family transporter [Chitinophagaceae bacterium]
MEQKETPEQPFYIKATVTLLGLVLFFYILKVLGSVLTPLAFAGLFAILLNPLFNRLSRRMSRIPAIILTLLVAIGVVGGLFFFLSSRIAMFSTDLPLIKEKFTQLLAEFQTWTNKHLGPSVGRQIQALQQSFSKADPNMITNTLGTVFGVVSVLILMPIYIFLLLFYKPLLLDFIYQVSSEKHSLRLAEILSQIKSAIQSFMVGLMTETAIVCTLNSIALLIIGVPNAIVIGVIGGLLNILPYIGGLIAVSLPLLMSLIDSNNYTDLFFIIGAYMFIQFIDNNFLVPRIVSSKVKINALMSIVAVLLGGLLWGVAGMFLSIPFIAVLKIIFDRIDELKPWGKLLGDEVPTEHIGVVWQKRWDRIFRRMEKKKQLEAKNEADAAKVTSTEQSQSS